MVTPTFFWVGKFHINYTPPINFQCHWRLTYKTWPSLCMGSGHERLAIIESSRAANLDRVLMVGFQPTLSTLIKTLQLGAKSKTPERGLWARPFQAPNKDGLSHNLSFWVARS